jgi:hypothetical protein
VGLKLSVAVSYDFVRSNRGMSGYGYAQGSDPEERLLIPKHHGIDIGNLRTGEVRTLYTVAELIEFESEPSMAGAFIGSRIANFRRTDDVLCSSIGGVNPTVGTERGCSPVTPTAPICTCYRPWAWSRMWHGVMIKT